MYVGSVTKVHVQVSDLLLFAVRRIAGESKAVYLATV